MTALRVLGISGALMVIGIIVGALAAHALQKVLSSTQLDALHTAVNYQLINSLGLILIGVLMRDPQFSTLSMAASFLLAGIVCFSGGIYLMLLGAPRLLGLVTPAGGILLILGWTWFAVAMFKR